VPQADCKPGSRPPGTCTCNEKMCTLRPSDPRHGESAVGCKSDADCAVDVGTGTCHLGGETLVGPISVEGPVCLCDKPTATCRLTWSGPVACTSWRDCSWTDAPRLRPVSSRDVRRPHKRPVRPCKDGETDSVCSPEKVCTVVHWTC
jgi:hypothetical protein